MKKSINAEIKTILAAVWILCFMCIVSVEIFAQREGGGAISSIDEVAKDAGGGVGVRNRNETSKTTKTAPSYTKSTKKRDVKPRSQRNRTTTAKTTETKESNLRVPKPYDGFVIGDEYTFLNFEVVDAPRPVHTLAAKEADAKGLVQVEILIGEDGKVLTARARTGNKLLHPEAEKAALATTLNKPTVYGKPARAKGFLVYRFGKAED